MGVEGRIKCHLGVTWNRSQSVPTSSRGGCRDSGPLNSISSIDLQWFTAGSPVGLSFIWYLILSIVEVYHICYFFLAAFLAALYIRVNKWLNHSWFAFLTIEIIMSWCHLCLLGRDSAEIYQITNFHFFHICTNIYSDRSHWLDIFTSSSSDSSTVTILTGHFKKSLNLIPRKTYEASQKFLFSNKYWNILDLMWREMRWWGDPFQILY